MRVSDSCQVYTSHEDPLGARGNRWFGSGPAVREGARRHWRELQKGYIPWALYPRDGSVQRKKVWDLPNPSSGEPGILSTASGLVFLGGDGGLLVLDGKTGKALHSVNLGHISQAGADDLHGRRQTVHRAARHGGVGCLRFEVILTGLRA